MGRLGTLTSYISAFILAEHYFSKRTPAFRNLHASLSPETVNYTDKSFFKTVRQQLWRYGVACRPFHPVHLFQTIAQSSKQPEGLQETSEVNTDLTETSEPDYRVKHCRIIKQSGLKHFLHSVLMNQIK